MAKYKFTYWPVDDTETPKVVETTTWNPVRKASKVLQDPKWSKCVVMQWDEWKKEWRYYDTIRT